MNNAPPSFIPSHYVMPFRSHYERIMLRITSQRSCIDLKHNSSPTHDVSHGIGNSFDRGPLADALAQNEV
eukprot:1234415-Pleurochrysis_carterae.AAC.4